MDTTKPAIANPSKCPSWSLLDKMAITTPSIPNTTPGNPIQQQVTMPPIPKTKDNTDLILVEDAGGGGVK